MSILPVAKTQKELFAEELIRLRQDVTESDRKEAHSHLNLKSPATLSIYLNGKGKNNDLAAAMITFFKDRIAKRNEVLA